jgi:long-subunit acyl-CoA synthetase (AMP-forming)
MERSKRSADMQLPICSRDIPPRKTFGRCTVYLQFLPPFTYYFICSVGRQDDVLILSTGEKTVPAPIEDAIVKDKRIRSAILFGRGRDQVGVLIEPAKYDQDPSAFVESAWPSIEAATADSPAFSRIFRHMILVTKEDKPMLRADKGTIKKKATIAAYSEEIDAL